MNKEAGKRPVSAMEELLWGMKRIQTNEILEEVVKTGTPEQRRAANDFRERLESATPEDQKMAYQAFSEKDPVVAMRDIAESNVKR